MNRLIRIALLLVLLCSCSARNQQAEIAPVLDANGHVKPEPAIAELAQLYRAAGSEQERRSICLRAIDEGRVKRGGPVLTFDQIFGTKYASELPREGQVEQKALLFATQPEPRDPIDRIEAVAFVGSYLVLEYDHKGDVQYYYLSNLHKGMASRRDGQTAPSAELKRLYETASSEPQRRDVAFRAIDEGVIQIFPRVNVSTVDEVFGTHLGSNLPTKKQHTTTGFVNFNQTQSGSGWFMAIEYEANGNIFNYYVTNIHK
jgi:hypothetical protein